MLGIAQAAARNEEIWMSEDAVTNFRSPKPRLPGDPSREENIRRMIRVDHAGEVGATRIYAGQLAVLKGQPIAETIKRMAAQEERHREVFDGIIRSRRVRPTALRPLWDVAGFALGAATALLGDRAAMACTVAVEEVIEEHYRAQAETLGDSDPDLLGVIEEFRAEEIEHRDIGQEHGAERIPGYPVLRAVIGAGSKLAIWLSARI